MKKLIDTRVHDYYWNKDLNCAITTLHILSEIFHIELHPQVIEGAFGLNAGRCGTQCGLVQGALIFIGIFGNTKKTNQANIKELCHTFCTCFEHEFGSLLCRELRPQGFSPDNPPHLCENITKLAIAFSAKFVSRELAYRSSNFNLKF